MSGYFKIDDWEARFHEQIDISVPITFQDHKQITAFCLSPPSKRRVLSIEKGDSCQCECLTFTPHVSGTHLETLNHLYGRGEDAKLNAWDFAKGLNPIMRGFLINYPLRNYNLRKQPGVEVVLIRTGYMHEALVEFRRLNQENWKVPDIDCIYFILRNFPDLKILMIDTPSLDEERSRNLSNHNLILTKERAIVELINLCPELKMGHYFVQLNPAPIQNTDATPCWPKIFPAFRRSSVQLPSRDGQQLFSVQ